MYWSSNCVELSSVIVNFSCGSTEIFLPVVQSYILVRPAAEPSITIRGRSTLSSTVDKLKAGVPIFEDINISVDFAVENTEGKVNHILGKDEIQGDGDHNIELGKEEKLQLKLEKKKAKRGDLKTIFFLALFKLNSSKNLIIWNDMIFLFSQFFYFCSNVY